nr:protein FAM91A1-like isoform X1 [Ipomoea batatas]GME15826.1 protein FAM91A1-like isoform X1 [Ipomoea batatas]
MHHAPTTLEDQLILKAIKEECPWENLPKRLQATLNSTEEWHKRIIDHCLRRRHQWNSCFARKVCKEGEYYEEMMRYLRRNLALFPYHLAEYICRVMRVSPFRYYCDMLFEVMKNEQPYDSIPNFSAADALRLTGIGRNEFIDIMNKCRSKKLTEEEMATIDKICKEEVNSFILFDPEVVKGLYRRGLVYFDVPVYPDDRFKVSRLEGFVSNREQSYEDPIEELLYAVFVVLSENSTVAELAATLQADLSQLQAASSFACRLGWAIKLLDPGSILQDTNTPGSPKSSINDEEDGSRASLSSGNMPTDGSGFMHGDIPWTENQCATSGYTRVAFLVDANITSYLMMGSVSPGLKSHAVTLYEAGKLGHDSIADLCKDLSTLEGAKFEGELQEFANHAFSLRCVLECLTSGGVKTDDGVKDGIPSCINPDATSLVVGTPSTTISGDFGTCVSELTADDYASTGSPKENPDAYQSTVGRDSRSELTSQLEEKMVTNGSVDVGKGAMTQRRYRVDVLRCESLAALSPATLDRLFLHDYDIVVSMVPLPTSAVLPGSKGPLHFGPPSYSSMTPWMKLSLYSTMGSGPLSVVLMKGQCLRTLPAPLAGCEKALVWSWDGSSIGGLGGKSEGNLVKGSVLLHCLNSLLKYSAVLVQPLSRYDLDEGGRIVTLEIPLPLMNSDGSTANIGEEMGLHPEVIFNLNSLLTDLANKLNIWSIGYIRLIRLFKEKVAESFAHNAQYEWVPVSVEFGIPLFSPKLCSDICKRVVSSQLLQMDLFTEHHDAMQELRMRLRNVCDEYRATGPAARLLYQKEQSKEQSSRKLMTYASGRWNPLVDPSSPISGTMSEHQRLKLASRSRCRTEVLSFDGKILSVYEAATRIVEESSSTSTVKTESDDAESKEVIHPGVNLLFDGFELLPFDIGACLQARQPAFLIAEASAASVNSAVK